MKRLLARWLLKAMQEENKLSAGAVLSTVEQDSPEAPPKMRFAIREAINGRFIEVATHRPQQRGSDWITEYYLVPEGKKVSEALALLMLMKGADDAPSR